MLARLLQPIGVSLNSPARLSYRLAFHVVIGALSTVLIFSDIGRRAALPDESCWIASSIHYSNLLESGNFYWRDWACSACGTFDARYNPHVGRWILAVPLDRVRWQADPGTMCYDFGRTREWNRRDGRLPPQELLLAARHNVAWAGVGVVGTLAIAGHVAGGPIGAIVTAALVLDSRLFRNLAVAAQTDMQFNLFLAGLVLALTVAARRWRRWRTPLLLGLLAGLAASVKVSAAVFIVFLIVPFLCWQWWRGDAGLRSVVRAFLTVSVATWLTLVAVNPFYWPDVTSFSPAWLEYDVRHWLSAKRKPSVEHMAEISNWMRPFEIFFVLDRWRSLLAHQRARREHLWREHRLLTLNQALWTRFNRPWREGLAVAGLTLFVFIRRQFGSLAHRPRSFSPSSAGAVLWFALASWLFIALFMQVNWPRYYLPATLALKLAAGVGTAWMVRQAIRACVDRFGGVDAHRRDAA